MSVFATIPVWVTGVDISAKQDYNKTESEAEG